MCDIQDISPSKCLADIFLFGKNIEGKKVDDIIMLIFWWAWCSYCV